MIIRNVTREQLDEAIRVNPNLMFNRCDPEGRGFRVTLRVKSSKGDYHRRAANNPFTGKRGRRLVAACYHGHYAFMERLFDLAPEAIIRSAMATFKGVEDFEEKAEEVECRNVGAPIYPTYYGDACDCDA